MPEDYQFSKRAGRCTKCSRDFQHGEDHWSSLVAEPLTVPMKSGDGKSPAAGTDAPAATKSNNKLPWRRQDYCLGCWEPDKSGEFFSFWKTTVPDAEPEEKKPIERRIDPETVYEMFRRLEGTEQPDQVKFRFILGLILMRKKRLRFSSVEKTPDAEFLILEEKAEGLKHRVKDPGLAEEEIDSLKSEVDRLLRGDAPGGGGT